MPEREQQEPETTPKPSAPPTASQPYFHQKEMEEAMKDHPGLTEEKLKEMVEAYGF